MAEGKSYIQLASHRNRYELEFFKQSFSENIRHFKLKFPVSSNCAMLCRILEYSSEFSRVSVWCERLSISRYVRLYHNNRKLGRNLVGSKKVVSKRFPNDKVTEGGVKEMIEEKEATEFRYGNKLPRIAVSNDQKRLSSNFSC